MIDLAPLREFLSNLLKSHRDHAPFADDESLFRSGRLDSVDVMDIMFFLEETYGVDFKSRGIKTEEFDSVTTMNQLFLTPPTNNPA